MAGLFKSCPDEVDGRLSEEVTEEERCFTFSRKQEKILNKVCKLLKKQNKMLRQEKKRQCVEKENEQKNDSRKGTGFLREFGRAICKAVPAVLTTLATLAFNFIFMGKRTSTKSGLQFAGSWR